MKTLKIWFNAMVFMLLIMGGMISTEIFSKPIYSYWLGICIGIFLTISSIMFNEKNKFRNRLNTSYEQFKKYS